MEQRIVVTYTTLPDRYELLKNSINSILQQTISPNVIYITIPKRCKRLNKEYPPVPKELSDICTIVSLEMDYGPVTKIYGGIMSEQDPDTIIISCDDDTIYPSGFIEKLVYYANKHSDAAICGTGALISRGLFLPSINTTLHQFRWWNWLTGFEIDKDNGRDIDLVFGIGGVLYRRKFFPPNDEVLEELFKLSLTDDALFHNDDVIISGYLSKRGIKRKVFYDIPSIIPKSSEKDALSNSFPRTISRLYNSIQYAKEQGLFPTMEPLGIEETIPGRVVLLIILFIIMVLVIIISYQKQWHYTLMI